MSLPIFDPQPDIRLIAADMDGTLLDDDKSLPRHFEALVAELVGRDVVFCVASGRQYANLYATFGAVADGIVFLAENGAFVVRGTEEVSSQPMDAGLVDEVVVAVRELAASGTDVGVVVCGKRAAYRERVDPPFARQVDEYYLSQLVVSDLLERPDDAVLKLAVYDFESAEMVSAPALAQFADRAQMVVSGAHWLDVMDPATNKGAGIRSIQSALRITPAQTMVFGDFLNDLEMMDAADYSFAMRNAHPSLRERARYEAPANTENGVVRTISSVLGLPWTE